MVPLTTMCAAWTSPSTRACSETTSVPGWSGSAATLPRIMPSTRNPPLKKTLPSMRVVAPIRLSIRFCGLLSLRNMSAPFIPSAQAQALRCERVARPVFVNAHLNASHLGLRVHPEGAFRTLEVLERQAELGSVGVARLRYGDDSTAAAFRQIDHQLDAAVEVLAAARRGRPQQEPIAVFA